MSITNPINTEFEEYQLTSYQKDIWIEQQLYPEKAFYNVGGYMKIEGKINPEIFQQAVNELICQNDSLRIVISEKDGQPFQKFLSKLNYSMKLHDFSDKSNPLEYSLEWMDNEMTKPFTINNNVLFYNTLIKVNDELYYWLMKCHHIISDGYGFSLISIRVKAIYNNLINKETYEYDTYSYKDFILEDEKYLKSKRYEKDKEFWKQRLKDLPEPLITRKTNRYGTEENNITSSRESITIERSYYNKISEYCKGHQCSEFHFFLASISIYFSKIYSKEDIIIGVPILNRNNKKYKSTIGLFVNVIPLKISVKKQLNFTELMINIKNDLAKCYRNYKLHLRQIISEILHSKESNNPLFEIVLSYEKHNHKEQLCDYKTESVALTHRSEKNALSVYVREFTDSEDVKVDFDYQLEIFDNIFSIKNVKKHINNIINNAIEEKSEKLAKLDYITKEEKNQILIDFNNTKKDYPKDKILQELFEEQVEKTPDNIAVSCEDNELTYKELNEKSNQLARVLREKGVKQDTIVGLITEPSVDMAVGILGILKSGGAYLPIDPVAFPEYRIKYMLEQCQSQIIITTSKYENISKKLSKEIILIDSKETNELSKDNLEKINKSNNLAYIIYTSGTTGKPKGVMVEHKNIVNTIQWRKNEYQLDITDNVLQLFSYVFDGFITSFFTPLVSGARSVFIDKEKSKDPQAIKESITKNKITHFIIVPILYGAIIEILSEKEVKQLKIVTLAGEKSPVGLVHKSKEKNENLLLVNEYGPTENSVASTFLKDMKEGQENIIGQPINNTKVYIVDQSNKLQPIGVSGELCLAGEGIARGYLNRPELTNEKFILNPYNEDEKMYRTGDLARWLPDGNIEFLGRIDHQVKIRGYRIEIGEIEAKLLNHVDIKETVVVALEDKNNNKYLCAYIVTKKELTTGEIREYLSEELPTYMIPTSFVQLEKMPLTPNGKIDRKALPEPEANINTGVEYLQPTNEVERRLVEIYEEVLGVNKVGINDNFFDLGGDSIKAIQVSSRLNKNGMKLEIKDIMKSPSIKQLSTKVKISTKNKANQGNVEGKVNLTPIQRWFFDKNFTGMNHWNQAVMLYNKDRFDKDNIYKVFEKIVEHHDALRMIYNVENKGISQSNRGVKGGELFTLETIDLTGTKEYKEEIEKESNRIQRTIDLSTGPLVKLGQFKTIDGDYLLIIIHHLVIDGVSWRIILEDIETAYKDILEGKEIKLQEKTESFKDWSTKLYEYAKGKKLLREKNYWKSVYEHEVEEIKVDNQIENRIKKDSKSISLELSKDDTMNLLKNTNGAYNTEINDILLTTLGMALNQWAGYENIMINMEGHGRENIIEDTDISRTVGWFTSSYPITINNFNTKDITTAIKITKESFRKIPNKGIGHDILKYISPVEDIQDFKMEKQPEINFNYLGQFNEKTKNNRFGLANISSGETIHPEAEQCYKLDINGFVSDEKLVMNITYNTKEYKKETIETLANEYKYILKKVIEHCMLKENAEHTPSDYGDLNLRLDELENIFTQLSIQKRNDNKTNKYEKIERIYNLTHMQEGMLFHKMTDQDSLAYMEQISTYINGNIDIENMEKSINVLIDRYDILRTAIVHKGLEVPKQIVLKERKLKVGYEDYSNLSEEEKINYIKEFERKDRERGFDLTKDNLLRLSLIKLSEDKYKFIWSFHHIIMDGWCMPIVFSELFKNYSNLSQNAPTQYIKTIPFVEYVNWLEEQDKEEADEYWTNYLSEYEDKAIIPFKNKYQIEEEYKNNILDFTLNEETTKKLSLLAQENNVTLNTLFKSVWGVILQRYNNTQDVVYGNILSSRPPEIDGVEEMVGIFINAVPVRIKTENNMKFKELLRRVQEDAIDSEKYCYLPLAEVQSKTVLKTELINHMMIFENYPMENLQKHNNDIEINFESINSFEQTNYDFNISIAPSKNVVITFSYNSAKYHENSIKKVASHLKRAIESIIENPEIKIKQIDIISDKEKEKILDQFNNTKSTYKKDKTFHQLFEEQVEKTPDNIAVVFENNRITYKDLNNKANKVAKVLREKGVKSDEIVALMVERSIEMIVGIIGILKAGGAYLPIDPNFPESRKNDILDDSKTKFMLTQKNIKNEIGFEKDILYIEDILSKKNDEIKCENLKNINDIQDLAYVIYTSGSTGKPKGVMIEHKNIVGYINAFCQEFNINQEDKVLQQSTYCFDAFVDEVYHPLVKGGQIVIVKKEDVIDINKLNKVIEDNKISIISCAPLLLNELNKKGIPNNVKLIICGGDVLKYEHINNISDEVEVYNVYGPTEATVCATYYKCEKTPNQSIPIGKPIANYKAYILDENNEILPIGIPGQLCISGIGVARGYLNKMELTNEKFIDNPFEKGEKLYKTGDLAKWLPDGNIEFIGRIDSQVKIRGFRIEIGEIESQLVKHKEIREALVLAKDDENNNKYLCAYIITVKKISIKQLREYLSKSLPYYMIPQFFIQLEKMPETSNGKIDKKVLPEPEGTINTGVEYLPPTNEIEIKLVEVYEEVLGVDKVGINDNFFELGGDSIKAIQISSRLSKNGMKLEIKDIMKSHNILQLSSKVKINSENKANQGIVEGDVNLTSIQRWFFNNNFTGMNHWNQAVILYKKEGFDQEIIYKVFNKIVEHHDGLRMIYSIEKNEIKQYNRNINEEKLFTIDIIDLTQTSNYKEKIEIESNRIQRSIDLSKGPLVKLGQFKTIDGDYLLIVIHHLVVDGVSWRILLEDIETAYKDILEGNEIKLQEKTESFKDWSTKLQKYAKEKKILREKDYWKSVYAEQVQKIKVDNEIKYKTIKDSNIITLELSKDETMNLLKNVNSSYKTEINDILIASLGIALNQWHGHEKIMINMEGHGREAIIEDTDVSRTVGWFTSTYPIIIKHCKSQDIKKAIKTIKESFKKTPNKGIGHDILKYLTPKENIKDLRMEEEAEISFNYLGQINEKSQNNTFDMSILSTGQAIHPESEVLYKLDINGFVIDEKLTMSITYNKNEYNNNTIERLTNIYKDVLIKVIAHCVSKEKVEPTPSDYGDSNLGLDELEIIINRLVPNNIHNKINKYDIIERIYKLTHMQEGMLFHAMKDEDSLAYIEQTSLDINGCIHIENIEKSMNALIDKYDILRTAIVYKEIEIPRQVVLKERKLKVQYEDYSNLLEEEKLQNIIEFEKKDRERGFDLTKDNLLRLSLIKLSEEKHRLIWSFHHIILDGWCMPIVFSGLFDKYKKLCRNIPLEDSKSTPFIEYINWLEDQDKDEADEYWSNYLSEYEEKATIPFVNKSQIKGEYNNNKLECILDEETTEKLTSFAKENNTTLNIIFKSIWGLMLQRYNNTNDVVYGNILSSRPPEINGIEEMVGIFINAVPVRIKSESNMTFKELLQKIQEEAIDGQKYCYLPLAEIQSKTELRTELIDQLMIFENYPMENIQQDTNEDADIKIDLESINVFEQTNYDFNIIIKPLKNTLIEFSYNSAKYDDRSINKIVNHLETVIGSIIENPDIKISQIEITSEEEKDEILNIFNNTKTDYPKAKTINQLFEEQVEKSPNNIAVICKGKELTYKELNEKSNQLARQLIEKGVKSDTIVALMAERSIEMIIGILGIIKAGGAYLPIEPKSPLERIKYMLDNSQSEILLIQKELNEQYELGERHIVLIDNENLNEVAKENLEDIRATNNLAYIIYTSGSTGRPKGVMVEDRNVINLVYSLSDKVYKKYDGLLNVALIAPYVFDASVQQIFATLLLGHTLNIVGEDDRLSGKGLVDYYKENKIDISDGTPVHLSLLMQDKKGLADEDMRVKHFIIGGEALPLETVKAFKKICKSQITNVYGPTECCVDSTSYEIEEEEFDKLTSIPIGRPLPNERIHILDKDLNVVPIGVAGELYISGEGVSRGYLNNDELTKEKFISSPFKNGETMYKTGDLARWLSDGNIEFLGRLDYQVKIRGYRIEIGEIEAQLLNHEKIKETVVLVKEDESNNKYLCAYIVAETELTTQEIREHLRQQLPDYMIPSNFVQLEKMPLTSNGKIDRKSLPQPDGKVNTGIEYVPPTTEVEKKLVEIWTDVLSIQRIGIEDNFFELGGHSLKASLLVSKIHKELNTEIPLREVFKKPTIKELADYINTAKKNIYLSIEPAEEKEYYSLSSAQKRLYILNQLEGVSTTYNMPLVMTVEGTLDSYRFEQSFQKIIDKHESLRTSFEMIEGEPIQRIHKEVKFVLEHLEVEESNVDKIIKDFIKPFDLSKPELLRLKLLKVSENKHIMLLDMHHIISDGVSMNVLIKEICSYYKGDTVETLRIQYKDYSIWQNQLLQSDTMKKQEEYWINKFNGEIPVLNMPLDYQRPSLQSFEGNIVSFKIAKELTIELQDIAKNTETTMYMVLLAAYNTLLYKYTGQEDIVVGSPIAGRPHADLQDIIGMFVNTLAMRNMPEGSKTFKDFLLEVKENALNAYENQDYQFEELVDKLEIHRDMSRNAIFDTMFSLQNSINTEINIDGLNFKSYEIESKISKFDITLNAIEKNEEINFNIEYSTKLFKEKTIQRLANHFINLLEEISINIEKSLSQIKILKQHEEQQILRKSNNIKAEYPREKTIHELFEEQVEKVPNNVALICEGNELTYNQLNQKSNQLARHLKAKGVKRDSIVSIMVDRTSEMIIGIMAILKAGGAYLPIDLTYPEERIKYMLEDSQAKLLLTSEKLTANIDIDNINKIYIYDEELYTGKDSNIDNINKPNDLAYIIYTSGTTGKPKGTMIEHKNVVRLLFNDKIQFDFTEKDVWTMFHSFCFDFSVWEMYGALLYGAKLVIIPKITAQNPKEFLGLLKKENVTVLNQTPTAFYNLVQEEISLKEKELKLRYIIFGGEALKPIILKDYNEKYPNTKLINMYGITETTVHVTYKEITTREIENNISNIGKAIPTLTTYVMNKNMKIVPIGVAGELYVGGEGVARGYLNRKTLTDERFIKNPYNQEERLYKSGDLVRMLSHGDMEYLGRIDHQVKIRGYRVEIGEIETQLLKYEKIQETVVITKEDESRNQYLCAYIVSKTELTIHEVREHLKQQLPDYMIPSNYVQLEKMPLTSNGKIDIKKLAQDKAILDKNIPSKSTYLEPWFPTHKELAKAWEEVLGVEKIGAHDDFFELGGTSLNVIRICGKVKKYVVTPAQILKYRTIFEVSKYVTVASSNKLMEVSETMQKALNTQYYYLKNGDEDKIVSYLDCNTLMLYYVLKIKFGYEKIMKRCELLLRNFVPNMILDSQDNLKEIMFKSYGYKNKYINVNEKYAPNYEEGIVEIENILDKGYQAIISTDRKRTPFSKHFKGFAVDVSNETNIISGHTFIIIAHEKDKFYYVEMYSEIDIDNYIPYEGNKSIGIIDKKDLKLAFDIHLDIFWVDIDTNILNEDYVLKELIQCSIKDYYNGVQVVDGQKMYYGQEVFNLLIKLSEEGLNLRHEKEGHDMSLGKYLEWKIWSIISSRNLLRFAIINHDGEFDYQSKNRVINYLQTVTKKWFELRNRIIESNEGENHYFNSSYKNDLVEIRDCEDTLIELLKELVL